MTKPNREDLVIEEITRLETQWAEQDELIDHSLATNRGFDDYHRDWHDRQGEVRCSRCGGEWHGLPHGRCPGMAMTPAEAKAWVQRQPDYVDQVQLVHLSPQRPVVTRYDNQEAAAIIAAELGGNAGVIAGGREPRWQANPAAANAHTLSDLEELRAARWSSSQRDDVLVSGTAANPHYTFRRPRIRFWGMGSGGEMQLLEGTLEIANWTYTSDVEGTHSTITGHLLPPVTSHTFIPPTDRSGLGPDGMLQNLLDDANLQIEAHTWLPEDTQPVGTVEPGSLSMEMMTLNEGEIGFESVGTIAEDALDIEHTVETRRAYGGDMVRLAEHYETTINFSDTEVDPNFFNRLTRGRF